MNTLLQLSLLTSGEMRHMNKDPYATDSDSLSDLIETLKALRQSGFSTGSSPTAVLLEIFVDVSLQLKEAFKRDSELLLNPSLEVLPFTDALGNSKMVSVPEFGQKFFKDPNLVDIFTNLASFGIQVKKGNNALKSFMDLLGSFKFRHKLSPDRGQAPKITKETQASHDELRRKIAKATRPKQTKKAAKAGYHRRQGKTALNPR